MSEYRSSLDATSKHYSLYKLSTREIKNSRPGHTGTAKAMDIAKKNMPGTELELKLQLVLVDH